MRSGFTLIEVAVSLALGGLLLVAGYHSLAVVTDVRRRTGLSSDEGYRAAIVRQTIEDWLRGAVVDAAAGTGMPFVGTDRRRGSLRDDEVQFATGNCAPFESAGGFVKLYIDRSGTTRERGLVAEVWLEHGAQPRRIEILPEATELEIRYHYESDGNRRWLAAWASSVQLPSAVDLRVSGDSVLHRVLQLPILVIMNQG